MEEEETNSAKVLYKKFRKYYRKLIRLERTFLNTFIVDMLGYFLLFIFYLISTKKFGFNFTNILLILFPLISGFVTVILFSHLIFRIMCYIFTKYLLTRI